MATAVIYRDTHGTGEAPLAASWMDLIIKQIKIPKLPAGAPELH